MDPFGNFGWSFGFGFGWILIGVFVLFMTLAIARLAWSGFKYEREKGEEQARMNALKEAVCANKISPEKFDEEIHKIV